MVRTNQGGSILGFVIVGSVLALLLLGSAYFVRNNLASADDTDIAVQQDGEDTDEQGGEQPADDSENESGQPAENEDEDSDTEQPANDSDAPSEDTEEEPIPVAGNPDSGDDTPDDLPQTGMASTLIGSLMIGGLTAVAAVYRRSREVVDQLSLE